MPEITTVRASHRNAASPTLFIGLFAALLALTSCTVDGEDSGGEILFDESKAIKVLEPKAGTTFRVGDTVMIRWRTNTMVTTDLNIYFSPDGNQWVLLNTDQSVNIGEDRWENFQWVIQPNYALQGGDTASSVTQRGRIQITMYDGPAWGLSPGPFTVEP